MGNACRTTMVLLTGRGRLHVIISCITDVMIVILSRCVGYPNPPAPPFIVEIRLTMFYRTDRIETLDRGVKELHSFPLIH